jgi:phospholipid/cholesterol/gamma-HCH transport system substrate-binding protein
VLTAASERAPTDTLGQMIDELRAKIIPLIDDVQKAVQGFAAVAQRAADPSGPIERTLTSAADIVRRIEQGDGLAGRLITDNKIANDLEKTVLSLRELASQLEHTSKDPRLGDIVQRTNAILASLQTTTRNLAQSTPRITQNVVSSTDTLPATLLQAQLTAHELELLLAQLRHNWLFGGDGTTPAPATRAPSAQVRP